MESAMRGVALAFCLTVLCAAPGVALAQSAGLTVEIDHTQRLNLRGDAASVIVGNPEIADVTVVDARTLFVSGRGFGVTEIVVLDELGRTLYQSEVIVGAPTTGQVRVWRGAVVTEMACSTACAPAWRDNDAATP